MTTELCSLFQVIPSAISTECSTFLGTLDADTSLTACTNALISATTAFGPPRNGSSSTGDVNTALNNLCSPSSQCDETTIRTTLSDFSLHCKPELSTNLNQGVLQIYDVLYTISPLRTAACSKDDAGKYCASEIVGSAPAPSSLYSGSGSQQVVTPNFDTLESSNAAFLFLQPSLGKQLCVPCTRSIITAYISFESDTPYAPGLGASLLLGGQQALYQAIVDSCTSAFLSGAVQAAGSLANSVLHKSGAVSTLAVSGAGTIASLIGAVSIVLAAL